MDATTPQEFISSLDPERMAVAEAAVKEFVDLSDPIDILNSIEKATATIEVFCDESDEHLHLPELLGLINICQKISNSRAEAIFQSQRKSPQLQAVNG